jgi:chemotaxis methyl-accepting protein methylase
MTDFTEDQISDILKNYKTQKDRSREYYDKVKDTEQFKMKNRARAKKHYDNGYNVKRKDEYKINADVIKAKNLYYYYKKTNQINLFKEKHSDKYEALLSINYIPNPA